MKPKTFRFLSAITAVVSHSPAVLHATDSTWGGTTGALTGNTNDALHSWSNATNWSTNPTIPSSAGDNVTFANTLTGNLTVYLNGAITVGSIKNLDIDNEINIQNGTGGSINFSTGTSTVPSIDVTSRTNGVGLLLYATINGSNGLDITGATTTAIRFNGSSDWAGFSGGLSIKQGILAPQAANYNYNTFAISSVNKVLPTDERLTLGATGTTNFNLASGRDIALGSLSGTSSSYIYNSSTGASFAVLAVGNDNTSGAVFGGTIGNNSGNTTSANILHLHKIGTGTQEISGKITGTGNVVVNGGTLFLSNSANNNDYTGTTTVNSGATLKIGSSNALGNTSAGTSLAGNATLDLNGNSSAEVITINNGGNKIVNTSATAAALTADATLNADLTIDTTGNITTARLISGATRTVTKLGDGTLTTSGSGHNNLTAWDIQAGTVVFANTTGYGSDRGTTLNGGTLRLTGLSSNLINDSQSFTINSGTFDLNGRSEAVAAIGGNGGTITNGSGTSATLYVGGGPNGSSSASYDGVIQNGNGTLKLTKEGAGTQTLNGANTYTGTTTIKAGAIALGLNGTVSNDLVLGASTPTVGSLDVTAKSSFSQANVSGNGTLNIGAGKTVTVTGTLAPGFSPGTVNVTGNLALAASTSTTMEIGGSGGVAGTDSDYVNVTGTFTFDGLLAIVSYNGFDLTQDGSYNLFDAASFAGDFDGVSVGGNSLSFASNVWSGTYTGKTYSFSETTGVLTVVPEPRAALLGGLGLLALLRRRK